MRARYQGGSLAGFIIVGVLLALVVVGGLYGLNRYNAQKSTEVASNESSKQEQPAEEESPRRSDPVEETHNEGKTDDQSVREETREETRATSDSDTDSGAAAAANLPETGPADTALQLFVLAIVSFAAAHYVQSRRIKG